MISTFIMLLKKFGKKIMSYLTSLRFTTSKAFFPDIVFFPHLFQVFQTDLLPYSLAQWSRCSCVRIESTFVSVRLPALLPEYSRRSPKYLQQRIFPNTFSQPNDCFSISVSVPLQLKQRRSNLGKSSAFLAHVLPDNVFKSLVIPDNPWLARPPFDLVCPFSQHLELS